MTSDPETLKKIAKAHQSAAEHYYARIVAAKKIGYAELNKPEADHADAIGTIAKMLAALER